MQGGISRADKLFGRCCR